MSDVSSISGSDTPALAEISIVANKRASLQRWETQKDELDKARGLLSKLQDSLDAMDDLLLDLSTEGVRLGVTLSDDSALGVTVGSRALMGSHRIEIQQLATPHVLASQTFSADGTELAGLSGRFNIESGGGQGGEVGYDLDAGFTNSQAITRFANAIQDANIGIQATVIRTGTEVRLLLSGKAGGEEGILSSISDSEGEIMSLLGLAGNSAPGKYHQATIQESHDAQFTLDGLQLTSSTNALEEILPGVTMTLRAPTEAPVVLDLAPDEEAIKAKMEELVDVYNGMVDILREATRAGGEDVERGLLRGTAGLSSMTSQLRRALTTNDGSGLDLRDIGLEVDREGRLVWDDPNALAAAIQTGDLTFAPGSALVGFMERLSSAIKPYEGVAGLLNREEDRLSSRITALETRLKESEARLQKREEYLLKQITELQKIAIQIQARQSELQQLGTIS
ncbi:MAG: flagellar filament capping protein FliD [Candidatus Eisenbacteria bacterium]|uniref:Flagellar hook-associated protein 2 n=1 Tax=Eiseniibacteriota bacterium TaxID=2212470 RepID=A0A948WDV0_UNCEI|nr:flagellar filament capping protein FliD [Candidatus Eisenbacteria bacterium]MBU1950929.1 flagellar filament capping protein FliD [Candidatus Eisenbacteria bacterium]MBU2692198.1 flagellar filament capping protein FliD [Candidatus Eisenbacteria bacterium]